jgi:ribose/xylose/arabinose/galactoside ABC-type transport system permease subunit
MINNETPNNQSDSHSSIKVQPRKSLIQKLSLGQYGIVWGLIAMGIALSFLSPYFLSERNLLNVARQSSMNAIIAAGMTIVIISAGIDLSVGSLLAFSSCVMAIPLKAGWPCNTGYDEYCTRRCFGSSHRTTYRRL